MQWATHLNGEGMGEYGHIRDEFIACLIGLSLRILVAVVEAAAQSIWGWLRGRVKKGAPKPQEHDDERDG